MPIAFLNMLPLGCFFLQELLVVPMHNTYFLISFPQLGTIADSQTALRNLQGKENFILTLNKKVTSHKEKKIQTKQQQNPQGFRKREGRFHSLPGAAAAAPRDQPCCSTARLRELPSSPHPLLWVKSFETHLFPYDSLTCKNDPFCGEKAVY